jgi:glycosyltransferase involved in cell wall biosynthesis
MKPDKIYILTDTPMPTGMAPTNRILSYAKGFIKNGVKSEVIVFRKTSRSNINHYVSNMGIVDDVKYRYLFSYGIKSASFFKRRIDDMLGDLYLFLFALTTFNKNSGIIYYSSRTSPAFVLKIAKLIRSFVLLKEESEHPSVYLEGMNAFTSYIFSGMHYRLFDGYLLMTRNLVSYFREKYPDKPALLVPMTVDLERFTRNEIRRKKSITYIGSLNDEKDGVNLLLEAFVKIHKKFPDYDLNLYGKPKNEDVYQFYQNFVLESGLTERVFFRGSISNEKVPEILSESGVLVMARPDSIQARNGFPTKLGEYLATGNPAVVTSVGEIPGFLEDKVSAFIAKPGDVESLADNISKALENDDLAREVGINGRKIAEKYFNNVTQAESIIDFIYGL